jgi:glucokinase
MSGPGLELVYRALAELRGQVAAKLSTVQIVERAQWKTDSLCEEAVNCFCEMLGTFGGNLAVTLGAQGGIYIGGGVVPKLGAIFMRSGFRARFENKGRMSGYVAAIPVYVITCPYPAFLGISAMLHEAMQVALT